MLISEELMSGIEQYGRWNVQEFVAGSQDMMDVLTYLRAERILEMTKVMSFVTVDSVNFERRTGLPPPARSEEKANIRSNQSDSVAPMVYYEPITL
jgi:hypothetical protein